MILLRLLNFPVESEQFYMHILVIYSGLEVKDILSTSKYLGTNFSIHSSFLSFPHTKARGYSTYLSRIPFVEKYRKADGWLQHTMATSEVDDGGGGREAESKTHANVRNEPTTTTSLVHNRNRSP